MRHDLLLTGGHVVDPASGVDGRRDVAFASGRVAAVDTTIPRGTAREVVDVSGAYVAPGLVDLHAHAFIAGHDLDADGNVLEGPKRWAPRLTVRIRPRLVAALAAGLTGLPEAAPERAQPRPSQSRSTPSTTR